MKDRQLGDPIFAGNSRSAGAMRSHPWFQTSLGGADTWSASLKTAVGILLSADCPMFCVWGSDRIVFYNDACENLFQSNTPAIAIGQSIRDGAGATLKDIQADIEQVWSTGQPLQQASRAKHIDKEHPPSPTVEETPDYRWSYTPMWETAETIWGVFASGQIIAPAESSQSQALSEELTHERARFETVLSQLPAGVLIADAASESLILANNKANQILKHDYILGDVLLSYRESLPFRAHHPIGQPYLPHELPLLRSLHTGETVTHEEIELHFQDGSRSIIDVSSSPIRDHHGKTISAVAVFQDITQRQRAEHQLRETEERLRLAMEGAEMATWDVDLATGSAVWSERHFHMLGYEPTQTGAASADMWYERLHPDDRDWVMTEWQQARREQRLYQAEYRVIRADDGTICWVEALGNFRYDEQGKAVRSIGVLFHISDRKRNEAKRQLAEAAFRDQKTLLEEILRQAVNGIIVCSAAGQLTFVNRQARRLAQLDPESTYLSISLDAWGAAYDTEGRLIPTEEYCISRARRGEVISAYEVHMVRADGSSYDILVSAAPLWNEHQQIIGAVSTFVDISDRKQAYSALKASEERFRDLADNISQFAWMTDPNGWIFWFNKRWFDYTGTTLEEMQGWGWQSVNRPDHVERVVANFRHSIEAGEPWEDIFPLRSKDGTYRWFLSRALPIRDEAGHILRWFGTNTDITERKLAEENLAQSETELRLVTDTVPALIAFVDADQRYRFNNRGYESWFGQTTEALRGKHLEEVVGADAYAVIRPYVEQVLTGQEVTFESRLPFQNNNIRHTSATYVPQFSVDGQVVGFVAMVNDISDRKRAEASLRQSEEQLRIAQEAAGAGMWNWDIQSDTVTWSDELYRLYGFDAALTPSYQNWMQSLMPEDQTLAEQAIQEALEHNKNLNIKFRIQHPQNGTRWIASIGQPFYDSDGEPLRMTGIALDITQQKQFEQALIESEALAKARAEELTAIMETTPAAIWIAHDPECWMLTANQTAHSLMRIPHSTPCSVTTPDIAASLPFKICRNGQVLTPKELPMQIAAQTGQEATDELEFVFDDGTVSTLYGKAIPLFDDVGHVRGAIGGFVDITALKESERQREQLLQRERQAREDAEHASHIKDEFLAILSHELRTPLNPILGWATLLKRGKLNAQKMAIAAETIERNAKLQIQLIDDLLDISRIIRGKMRLNMAPTRLETPILGAIETVQLAAEAKNIQIQTQFDPNIGEILGDSARLQQILWNLLSNAVKFTPDGGRVTITLSALASDSASDSAYAQIQVSDTGKGIQPSFLPYIFEYFRQADSTTTRSFGGLGLGLAIVRYLVEMHGGTISARSPGEGQGATFTVEMPLLKRDMPHGQPSLPLAPMMDRSSLLQTAHILLVDDAPDTLEIITVALEELGAWITTADSCKSALKALHRFEFDLIVCDIAMPDMDGYSLLKHIRTGQTKQGADIPAIALTAYAGEINRDKAMTAGFHDHLPKPVDLDQLILAITKLV